MLCFALIDYFHCCIFFLPTAYMTILAQVLLELLNRKIRRTHSKTDKKHLLNLLKAFHAWNNCRSPFLNILDHSAPHQCVNKVTELGKHSKSAKISGKGFI